MPNKIPRSLGLQSGEKYVIRITNYVVRNTLTLLKLQFVQLPVFPILGEKLLVAARFDDASLVHYED